MAKKRRTVKWETNNILASQLICIVCRWPTFCSKHSTERKEKHWLSNGETIEKQSATVETVHIDITEIFAHLHYMRVQRCNRQKICLVSLKVFKKLWCDCCCYCLIILNDFNSIHCVRFVAVCKCFFQFECFKAKDFVPLYKLWSILK